jgi:hypothetical protein
MNRSTQAKLMIAALATAALGVAATAHASTDVHISVGFPMAAGAPLRVTHPVYDTAPRYRDEWRRDQEQDWRRACRAPAWNPEARYWPGQQVRRHGTVYVATRLSASVWNVNSPPEWTPNYWRATNCQSPQPRHAREWQPDRWR